jgi:hypothetical protein
MSWTCGTRHRLVKIDGNIVHGCHAPMNTDVLVVKFLLLATSAAALLRSFRFVSGARDTRDSPVGLESEP